MAILRPNDYEKFLTAQLRNFPLILIYGPDEGMGRTRIAELAKAALGKNDDSLSLIDIEAEILNADPPRLLDEAQAISMFGGERVIIVRHAARLNKSIWQAAFSEPPRGSKILFQADELTKTSPLRKAAEASENCMTIACYAPEARKIGELIDERCKAEKIAITPVARAKLMTLLGADSALSTQELDKLLLYCYGQLTIDIADIDAAITDTSEVSGSEPIDCAFLGKLEEIEALCLRSFQEGVGASAMLILALNHTMLLRHLVLAQANRNLDIAMKQQRIFFKREASIRKQAETWSIALLNRATETLLLAQEQSRQLPTLEETITIRALWSVALACRRQR